jgi:hypothetical protein
LPSLPVLYGSTAGDELDQQARNREYQQYVNESTERERSDQSQQPQHQQNHENGPKHKFPPCVRVAPDNFAQRTAMCAVGGPPIAAHCEERDRSLEFNSVRNETFANPGAAFSILFIVKASVRDKLNGGNRPAPGSK